MTKTNNYPKFISDKPLGKDLLAGESHDKIAKSITQFISENSDRNLIGIDGSWGSGKSNVIEILQNKYLKSTHNIFIFDAWGHQEDQQRRAILEELTKFLIPSLPEKTKWTLLNGDIKEGNWKERLTYLLSRKKNTYQQTTPRLSKGLIISLLVTILTPITKTIADSIDTCPIYSFIITAMPLLLGILASLYFVLWTKNKTKWSEFINIYKDNEQTKDISEIISDNEPNVSEFREWIKSISESISLGENPKKLIIVFDNMDRLPTDKVQALWSSIHTFFAECNYKNIWVIIPFDRTHIKDAFKADEEKTNHFINKTFTAIYRIPPPILTDWHKLFKLKFEEAFGQTEETEFHIVKSIFDLTQKNITPRNIISFINSIVSEKKLEDCTVKLRYIAVFTAFRKEILERPVDEILKPSFINNINYLFKGDNEFSDNIAALVYNLPIESARQITLTIDLKNTLKEKKFDRINEYASQKHFIEMLEKVINQEELDIENSILTIGAIESNIISQLDSQKLLIIWDTLCGIQQSSSINEQIFSDSQKLLLKNISPDRKISYIKYLTTELSKFKDFSGPNYYKSLTDIDTFIKANKFEIDIYSVINPVEQAPAIYLDYIKTSKDAYKTCKLTCNENELMAFLIEKTPNALSDSDYIKYVTVDFNFSTVILKIEDTITNNEVTLENLNELFSFYKTINDKRPLKFIDDAQLYTLINSAESNSKTFYELISMRLAKGSLFVAAYNKGICLNILTQVEPSFVREIAKRIECYKDIDDLLIDVLKWQQPLLIAVIKEIIENHKDFDSRALIVNVLPHYNSIITLLGINHDNINAFLNNWIEEIEESVNKENIRDVIPDIIFFENAITVENPLTIYTINTFKQHLQIVSVNDWKLSLIDDSSYYLRITYVLVEAGRLSNLPENLITAYKDILENISKGIQPIYESKYLPKIIQLIEPRIIAETVSNIRDHFILTVDITPNLFNFFSRMLIELGKLHERADQVTRRILTPVINDDTCLKTIIENSDFFADIVNNAGDYAVNFRDAIRLKVQSGSTIEQLSEFANKVKVVFETNNDDV